MKLWCRQMTRQRKRAKRRLCNQEAIALVGTAKVPSCHACECKFPENVPREWLNRTFSPKGPKQGDK